MARNTTQRVAVAGATGLIGRALLLQLRADPAIGAVHALVRTAPPAGTLPQGVKIVTIDYAALAKAGAGADGAGAKAGLPTLDWGLCALGTTIKTAGSPAAFRAVDVDAVVAFARAVKAAGARRFGVVSALGADPKSKVFYNRCKGEMEAALRGIGFDHLVIVRPSLLLGNRSALGQSTRLGERLAQGLTPLIGWATPRRLRPIAAEVVARALRAAMSKGPAGVRVVESDELRVLGAA